MSTTTEILPRTFVHVPGIGLGTERSLWENGITSWQKFLRLSPRVPAPLRSRTQVHRFIEQSAEALRKADAAFFRRHLPHGEWWRLYPNFESKAVFLDIETTGLSHYYDEITLVGLYDGQRVKTLLAGHNLERLSELLQPYDIIVTFNGTLFDIPFLRTKFPLLRLPPIHLDLRYLLKRLGFSGGLKQIEQKLGIKRSKETEAIDGLMATVLWARYVKGNIAALEQLIQYNAADITSLPTLMRFCYQQLTERLLHGRHSGIPHPPLQRPKSISVQVRWINGSGVNLIIDRESILLKTRPVERPLVTISNLLTKISSRSKNPKVVGIDLRASEIRPTGWALLAGDSAKTRLVKTDEEIIQETISHDPDIISIDSPLTLPTGRCCTQDTCECRTKGILRECERTLWRRGVRVFPCLLPSMQKLTERGIRLAKAFRKRGYTVIESYPGAAQDIMRIPRKKSSLDDLARGLAAFGIKGKFLSEQTNHDELDAITSAVVGYFYLTGYYEALGNEREDYLIIPKLDQLLSK
ncbi:MAG: ribonuclease H-like domain-containing protein [Nitrospiraceae bacterium]